MTEWMNNEILGITLGQYAMAFGAILIAFIAKKVFGFFFTRAIMPIAKKTKKEFDDRLLNCLKKPSEFLIFLIGLFIAVEILQLPTEPFDLQR